jgi:hypothetical protein
VDAGSGWQGQSNRDFIDKLGDAIQSKEPRLKLAVDTLGKRRRRALSEAK